MDNNESYFQSFCTKQSSTMSAEGGNFASVVSDEHGSSSHSTANKRIKTNSSGSTPGVFIRMTRGIFGYRKTSLTFFVFLTIVFTFVVSILDNSLEYSVSLPENKLENSILKESWLDLQNIAKYEHTYGSLGNDFVHDYLEKRIRSLVTKDYIEFDNDLNNTNKVIFNTEFGNYKSVSYYESNNLLVRINGTNKDLPAFLLSAHYDSVPSSFGVTDDGMGIASLLGVLKYYSLVRQPERTIIFNFNNNEEFGLSGANSFLSHPWFRQIKYFLNLEGTGAGGKAVLFRGTDYGMVNLFKNVRYPYGTSLFQQGFNNLLIHSETDYRVYKDHGNIRGLDLAFYKPRDLYHTSGDSVKNINIKSLWHMLANSLDFTAAIVSQKIDLDVEYLEFANTEVSTDFAVYASFFNLFFSLPASKLVMINITFLVAIPVIGLLFIIIIFNYKKNWKFGYINTLKYPLSLAISIFALNTITKIVVIPVNEFLPNSSFPLLIFASFAVFLVLNYSILNSINFIFKRYKGVNHDEKLVVLIQNSFIFWVSLVASTVKLANNRIGDDHTGEFPILLIFLFQSAATFFGLLGWAFKKSGKKISVYEIEESRPLLVNANREEQDYGSNDNHDLDDVSVASSYMSVDSSKTPDSPISKYLNYDWSIQYILVVPISSYIIYNSGYLILDGFTKSIQESLAAENLIFKAIQAIAIVWVIPFLPFVFKLNRIIILFLIVVIIKSFIDISTTEAFDQENPLKLRFIQTIDLKSSPTDSRVQVYARENSPLQNILGDIPSIKKSDESLNCNPLQDGMQVCSYNTTLAPKIPNASNPNDYISIDILQNSTSVDYPFGFLSAEFKINVPRNRMCNLNFFSLQQSDSISTSHSSKDPVKAVIVYADSAVNSSYKMLDLEKNSVNLASIPEGFSKDEKGNYQFKNLTGINQLQMNKLDWDKPYHVEVQWIPDVIGLSEFEKNAKSNKLGVKVECYWAELSLTTSEDTYKEYIPAYEELLHYSPNYVSWANYNKGLVLVSTSIEI